MKFVIFGNPPSKSNGYKVIAVPNGKGGFRGSLCKTDRLVAYEKSFALQVRPSMRVGLSMPLTVRLTVFFSSRRPDLDGAFKILLDCLQKNGIIENDRLIHQIQAVKKLDKKSPRVVFEIEPYQDNNLELWENL